MVENISLSIRERWSLPVLTKVCQLKKLLRLLEFLKLQYLEKFLKEELSPKKGNFLLISSTV